MKPPCRLQRPNDLLSSFMLPFLLFSHSYIYSLNWTVTVFLQPGRGVKAQFERGKKNKKNNQEGFLPQCALIPQFMLPKAADIASCVRNGDSAASHYQHVLPAAAAGFGHSEMSPVAQLLEPQSCTCQVSPQATILDVTLIYTISPPIVDQTPAI